MYIYIHDTYICIYARKKIEISSPKQTIIEAKLKVIGELVLILY